MDMQSVHPLTERNYKEEEKPKQNLMPGYNESDDLNHDGVIDNLEKQIKVMGLRENIRGAINDQVKEEYLRKFRKEVDFHHKVAYRYEKAYRLGKQNSKKRQ